VQVWDGADRTADLIGKSDIILISGTTLQNATFDAILAAIRAQGRTGIVYGVTGAGVCALSGIERLCPCGRDL
jgi:uncharacterized protein (DUF4213/DUF364 family)